MIKVNINTQPLVAQQLPNTYVVEIEGVEYTVENYPALTHLHHEHGWRDLVTPEIDHTTEKLGELIYDEANDVGTYEVIQKTVEEIEQELKQETKSQQEQAVQSFIAQQVISQAQELPDEEALQNQSLYPFWEVGIDVIVDEKRQEMSPDLTEVWLWKCLQAHTTQADWRPKDTPALWTRVGYDDEILDWVQPTGGHDAYNIGDQVKHNGFVWTSKVDGNVWEPTEANATLWEKGEEI